MLSYHNDPSIKQEILAQLNAHYDADEIIKGIYWKNGKGCAVGCTIHGDNHAEYETKFGIPGILASLEDCIFEGLPNELAKEWPIQFMETIPVGVNLSNVWKQFVIWLLEDPIYGVINFAKSEKDKDFIQSVINVYKNLTASFINYTCTTFDCTAADYASAAASTAASAAASTAASAAADAASRAYFSVDVSVASNVSTYAASAHAYAASAHAYAAYAASNVTAYIAAVSAVSAVSAESNDTYEHEKSKTYQAQANKLLELLQQEKGV